MFGKIVPRGNNSRFAGATLALLSVSSVVHADSLSVRTDADTLVRTDLDARRNDNYGCDAYLQLGTSRGGGGIPWGGADAMRSFAHFSLPTVSAASVVRAELQMTFWQFNAGVGSVFEADVHRVVDSGALTPWIEGNGAITTPYLPGCVNVDEANGMAWAATEPENQTQPNFDPATIASTTITQGVQQRGDVIRWDVTSLVRGWLDGSFPNYGLMIRDPSSDGSFRELYLASREHVLYPQYAPALSGPTLVLTLAPTLSCVGFEAPLNGGPVTVKKNRALPLKAQLRDEDGQLVGSSTLLSAPAVQVLFSSAAGGATIDVTSDAVPVGLATSGDQFVFTTDGKWQYNLKITNYTAPGEYTVSMVTGDASEYGIAPTCHASFIVE